MRFHYVLILAAAMALISVAPVRATPAPYGDAQARADAKRNRKQQKAQKKYVKAQKKSEKKMLKTERKNSYSYPTRSN